MREEGMGSSRDLSQAASGASLPAPLVERLATSSVALRQNWVFTGDGQAVKLGVQADEMEDAAICIAAMLQALQDILAEAEEAADGPADPWIVGIQRHARAAIAKALGREAASPAPGPSLATEEPK